MAKYKKIEDYYTSSDYSVKLDKGVNFKVPSGTLLTWVKTEYKDGIEVLHRFEIKNTPFFIEVDDSNVAANVVSFGEEAQRAAK